jgi:hypothetical protein
LVTNKYICLLFASLLSRRNMELVAQRVQAAEKIKITQAVNCFLTALPPGGHYDSAPLAPYVRLGIGSIGTTWPSGNWYEQPGSVTGIGPIGPYATVGSPSSISHASTGILPHGLIR